MLRFNVDIQITDTQNVNIQITDTQNVNIQNNNTQNVDIQITDTQNVDIQITDTQNVDIQITDTQNVDRIKKTSTFLTPIKVHRLPPDGPLQVLVDSKCIIRWLIRFPRSG
jgi:hypothetical protein